MHPGEKLARARKYQAPSLTQEVAAKKLGLTRVNLARYEATGKSIKQPLIDKAAAVFGIPPDWFLDGEDTEPPVGAFRAIEVSETLPLVVRESAKTYTPNVGAHIPIARTGFKVVPVYGSIPAGTPGVNFSEAIDYAEMPDWGDHFLRWGRRISGDSMQPEFEDGDIVIFENRRAEDFHGVHARRDGEDLFKICRKTAEGYCDFWPTNPEYEKIDGSEWEVLGVTIERRRLNQYGSWDIRPYPGGWSWRFR